MLVSVEEQFQNVEKNEDVKTKGTLLIVDDNQAVLNSLELFLKYKFGKVIISHTPQTIQSLIREHEVDVVLLDMNFTAGINTGNEGIFWMKQIHKIDPAISIVLITAYGDIELAVKAVKEGATDFVLKPWDNNKLLATLEAAFQLRLSKKELSRLKQKQHGMAEEKEREVGRFLYRSAAGKEIFNTIRKLAKTEVNVLLLGENGTGKEIIAHEIHRQSLRKDEIFVKVDIGSLSESLFESELFGHAKGSFTDAKENRIGKFEHASGGTLFLDEIGNLTVGLQAKLLSVLQNRAITPVGSNREMPVDFRLICATNKNLEQLVKEKLFREDLYYRINTIRIEIPPLRERREDILLLTDHYLHLFSDKYEKPGLKIDQSALGALSEYSWPGNVRELKHTIEKAILLCETTVLKENDFSIRNVTETLFSGKSIISMDEVEKMIIADALNRNKGNIQQTATDLKIGRQTLYRKIRKYHINF